jgi:protein-tyrosine phosphatase
MVNIVKIKDSIFIGDISAGTNRDLIEEFKISHIINTTNNIGLNSLEFLNIKYLNLNWIENSKQQLFESGDENVFKIMNFIDNADKNGEGILIFSIRGQNRCCIVIIIFLMKKYNWCVKKCIDFLISKKINLYIPNYFLSQLNEFEIRINKFSKIKKSINWNEEQNNRDFDESIMRNTYINTLPIKKNINNNTNIKTENENKKKLGIIWKDKNNNNINDLVTINFEKDLFYKKNINPIRNHILMKPKKSCMKKSNNNNEEEIENKHLSKTKSNNIESINKENVEITIRPLKSAKRPKINNTFNKINNNQFQKNTFLNNIINKNNTNSNLNDSNNKNSNSYNNIYIQESYKPDLVNDNKKKNLKNVNIFLKINTNNNNFIKPYETKIPFGTDYSTKLGVNNFLKDYSSINIGKEKVLLNNLGLNYNYFPNHNFMFHSPTNNNINIKPFVKKRNLINTILNKKQNFSFSNKANSYNQIKFNNNVKKNSFFSPDKKTIIFKKKLTFQNEEINNNIKRPSTANEQNKIFTNKKTKVYPKLLKRPTSPMIKTYNDNTFLNKTSNNDFPKNPSLPNSIFGYTIDNFFDSNIKKLK